MERYRVLEHTADIGIEAFGRSKEMLFENAAWGLFDTLSDATKVEARLEKEVRVTAPNSEELLVRWLAELLYLYDTERLLFSSFQVQSLNGTELRARVGGEPFDPRRHAIRYEIKAVTYHGLAVAQARGAWKAAVIFDI